MTNNQANTQPQTYQAIIREDGTIAFTASPAGVRIATSNEVGRLDLTPEGFTNLRRLTQKGSVTAESLLSLEQSEGEHQSEAAA